MKAFYKDYRFDVENACKLHKLYFGYWPSLPVCGKEGAAQWVGETICNAWHYQLKKAVLFRRLPIAEL